MSIGHKWSLNNLCYYKCLLIKSNSVIWSGTDFTCILSSCSTISVRFCKLRFRRDVTPLNFSKTFNFTSRKIPKGQTKKNMADKNYLENYILVSRGSFSHWKVEVRDIPQMSSLRHIKYWAITLITVSKYFLLYLQLKLTCRGHFSLKNAIYLQNL